MTLGAVILIILALLLLPILWAAMQFFFLFMKKIEQATFIASLAVGAISKLKEILSHSKSFPHSKESSRFSLEEAAELLEVNIDSSDGEIEQSFKRLIKINHPDRGGSKYITKQLIAAREILLKSRKR